MSDTLPKYTTHFLTLSTFFLEPLWLLNFPISTLILWLNLFLLVFIIEHMFVYDIPR